MHASSSDIATYIERNQNSLAIATKQDIRLNASHYFPRFAYHEDAKFACAHLARAYVDVYLHEPKLIKAVAEAICEHNLLNGIPELESTRGHMRITEVVAKLTCEQATADLDLVVFDNDHWISERAVDGIDMTDFSEIKDARS